MFCCGDSSVPCKARIGSTKIYDCRNSSERAVFSIELFSLLGFEKYLAMIQGSLAVPRVDFI